MKTGSCGKKRKEKDKGLQAQLLRKGTQLHFGKVDAKVQLVWIVSVSLCQSDSGSLFLASPQNHRPKHTLVTEMEAALLTDRNQPPVSRRSGVHECRPPSGFTSPPSALCDTFSGRSRLSAKSRSNLFFSSPLSAPSYLRWNSHVPSCLARQQRLDQRCKAFQLTRHFKETEQAVKCDLWPLTCSDKGKCRPLGNWANHLFKKKTTHTHLSLMCWLPPTEDSPA